MLTNLNIEDLLKQCSAYLAADWKRLNERERRALDRIIERFEESRTLSTMEISFLENLYRRTKIHETNR